MEGWGVVQSREHILVAFLAAAAAAGLDGRNKLSNLYVSGSPVSMSEENLLYYCTYIYYYIFRMKRMNRILCVNGRILKKGPVAVDDNI